MRWNRLAVVVPCSLLLLGWAPSAARAGTPAAQQQRTRAGATVKAEIERVATAQEASEVVGQEGAAWIKLHFTSAAIEPGGYLRVVGEDGRVALDLRATEGRRALGEFWAAAVDGAGARIQAQGAAYRIDSFGAGSQPVTVESIQFTDNREDRECFGGETAWHLAEAVGRMLFQSSADGLWYLCTGSIVSGSNHFLTNNHCVSNQTEVDSLDVRFNYDNTTCGGSTVKTFDTHGGGTFLRTNAGLDYTLLTLDNNTSDGHGAADEHGYLQLRGQGLATDESLWLPQHGGGSPKQITDTDCYVVNPMVSETGYTANSSMFHYCDTEGGSSGSPVLNVNNQVVGLHHFGYGTNSGQNGAILMSQILPAIEDLLPATSGGSGSAVSSGWVWYQSREAWWYRSGGQARVWMYVITNNDYFWADEIAEGARAEMLTAAAKSGHWLGIYWRTSSSWSNTRLWWY